MHNIIIYYRIYIIIGDSFIVVLLYDKFDYQLKELIYMTFSKKGGNSETKIHRLKQFKY